MRDRTSGPGDDRHRTERLSRAPGEEWTPEQDSPDTDEWTPGAATPTHRTPRRPRPEERLPGEPGRAETPRGGTAGWISGTAEGASDRSPEGIGTGAPGGRLPGTVGPGREGLTGDDRTPEDTPAPPPGPAGTEGLRPGTEGAGYGQAPASAAPPHGPAGAEAGEGFAGRPRPGREGFTGDDRAPGDIPAPPPGPAGAGAGQWRGAEETGQWRGTEQAGQRHGTEGPRPGTEETGAGADDGFGASHRAERDAISEEDRMPDNGLGAPAPGEASRREATTTDTPGRDTWPTAPGAPTRDALRSDTTPATGPVGTEPLGAPAPAQPAPSGHGSPLIAREEVEEWQRRMREVAGGFVDQPKGAVERADRTLEEIAARFSEAVTRRRRTLRMSWEVGADRGGGADSDTEQLRLALRDYRELAERLLHA
ncbi:hypothetical protein ABZ595_12795 [Streptomyces rubradiris]|uniref:hypothetical protein n=1 Tax=Streptomyces rubradiris TaxID=285531 RepID=UPI0033CC8D70